MVAFARNRATKPEPPVPSSHFVMALTAKSSHAYMGLLMLGALISELQQEFPWRTDLNEAADVLLEIADDLEIRPVKK